MNNIKLIPVVLLVFSLTAIIGCRSNLTVALEKDAFIKDWLLLGPLPNCDDCDAKDFKHGARCKGFATDYLAVSGGEYGVKPYEGDKVKVSENDEGLSWFIHHSDDNEIHLNDLMKPNDMVVAYAYTEIISPENQKIILSVGSNDGVKVFLNGEKVHEVHLPNGRWLQSDDDFIPVRLKKGSNDLLLKIDEGTGDFGFVVRFLDYDSTIQAVKDHIDGYSKLALTPRGDSLLVTFGDSYRLSVLNPDAKAQLWLKDASDRIVSRKDLWLGEEYYIPMSELSDGLIWAVAKFNLLDGGTITKTKEFYKGKLKRHALPEIMDADMLLPKDQHGKTWFPIGTYGAPEEDYTRLKKAGYNFVVASTSQLDNVQKAGLKAAVSVHGTPEEVRNIILKNKNHPAVLCWMLYDEPAYNQADLLFIHKLYEEAYKADPVHPSYLVVTTSDAYKTYGRCGDILSVDTYPIRNGVITHVARNISRAYIQSDGDQPVWHCGQMFRWPGQRRPTPREHRFMTYTALMAGAKGLLWYTYKGYGQYLPDDDPELWEAQKQLLKEINELAFVFKAKGLGESIQSQQGIMVVIKKVPGRTYLFAANTSESETIETTLTIGNFDRDVMEVYGENRKPILVDGRIKDTFKPLDVHIYRLE